MSLLDIIPAFAPAMKLIKNIPVPIAKALWAVIVPNTSELHKIGRCFKNNIGHYKKL